MTDLARHRSGLLVRPDDNGDRTVVGEMSLYRKLPILAGDTVLDIGGHIGAFTRLVACARGVGRVIVVEPDPENVEVLRENVAELDTEVVVLHGAVVAGMESEVTLYRNLNKSSMHTLITTRGRPVTRVAAFQLRQLLWQYQPAVVKMDIEGGEYLMMGDLVALPDHVEALAIEIHPYKGDRTRERSRELVAALARQFTVVKEPRIGEKNWITTGVYARGAHGEVQ